MSAAVDAPFRELDDETRQLNKELIVFALLAALISWPLLLIVLQRTNFTLHATDEATVRKLFGNIVLLYGCGPLLAAIAVTAFYRGKAELFALFKAALRWKVPLRWYLLALLLPVLPQWAGLFAWAALNGTALTLPPLSSYLVSWLQITLFSAAHYLTEELGWRGFMLPRALRLTGWIKASLILGLVWSVWHYPLWLLSSLMTSGSLPIALTMVATATVFATAISLMLTRIYMGTCGSVLLAMVLHGASQANLTNMYAFAGSAALSDARFGSIQAAAVSCVALLLILTVRQRANHNAG